ncbi:hypothetical protein QBC38DRAFT_503030 [Podospora fimiseda]|uniref:Uncharacterized protein n=1 Tax=Podospora fimiseda TaxID=252190 RepID=A0AAN7GV64_9PEZI|nr:hypothetical protein QBC38DRAFT_503030 [Podospora fimiseda]
MSASSDGGKQRTIRLVRKDPSRRGEDQTGGRKVKLVRKKNAGKHEKRAEAARQGVVPEQEDDKPEQRTIKLQKKSESWYPGSLEYSRVTLRKRNRSEQPAAPVTKSELHEPNSAEEKPGSLIIKLRWRDPTKAVSDVGAAKVTLGRKKLSSSAVKDNLEHPLSAAISVSFVPVQASVCDGALEKPAQRNPQTPRRNNAQTLPTIYEERNQEHEFRRSPTEQLPTNIQAGHILPIANATEHSTRYRYGHSSHFCDEDCDDEEHKRFL